MWSALSVETVMPSLMMCDQLSNMGYAREDASDIKRKSDFLQQLTQMSLEGSKRPFGKYVNLSFISLLLRHNQKIFGYLTYLK